MTCYGCSDCDQFTVIGTCTCTHAAGIHSNIEDRFVSRTPCSGTVVGATNFSGTIARTMPCPCDRYEQITLEILNG